MLRHVQPARAAGAAIAASFSGRCPGPFERSWRDSNKQDAWIRISDVRLRRLDPLELRMPKTSVLIFTTVLALMASSAIAQVSQAELDLAAKRVEANVIEMRRDFHQHPELSNRETRTAEVVAKRLRALKLDVKPALH
jgi:hypothetical protein